MQACPVTELKCTVCDETFRSKNAMQQHIDQTRHMMSRTARVPVEYLMEGSETQFYCKLCQKPFESVAAVLQHDLAKHTAPKKLFCRRCDYCNMEQTTPFGWLNHRGDCKKVPDSIRHRIKLKGIKCTADPKICAVTSFGLGLILHMKDQHGIDRNYFEDDFAEQFAKEGLVQILDENECKQLPQHAGLMQQFELSAQANGERLKKLHEARLRVIEIEGEDLASRRKREFEEVMELLRIDEAKKNYQRRHAILSEKSAACAAAAEAEQKLTDERMQKFSADVAEMSSKFKRLSYLMKNNDTAAAQSEVQQMLLKFHQQSEAANELARKQSTNYMEETKEDIQHLQDHLRKLRELKKSVEIIVEKVQAKRAPELDTDFSALERHNVAPDSRLGRFRGVGVAVQNPVYSSMTLDDIFREEERTHKSLRKPMKIDVPSLNWFQSYQMWVKCDKYRIVFENFKHHVETKTAECAAGFKGKAGKFDPPDSSNIFATWYVFYLTFDDCYYFVKKLMNMDASESKEPYVKRFMADPVLFYQALNLRACNSERLGVQGDAFIRLLNQAHPDIEGSASNSDKKTEHAGDGDSESKADKKVDGGKSHVSLHNNVIKFACCIPKQLRYKLQDALRHFSKDLFSNLKTKESDEMQQGKEVNYFDMLGQKYFIFFGSTFWLDIMRARFACFKQKSLSIRQYVCSCLKIRIDIDGPQGKKICLHVPWQDIVLSVRATVPCDIQPSLHDWSCILRDALGVSVSNDSIDYLVKLTVHPYQEMWSVLDAAYDTPSKGFFDFEGAAKQVFWTALQEDLSPQLPVEVFENWWSSLRDISEMRDKAKTRNLKNREAAISNLERYLAAAHAHEKCSQAFWLHSAKALWLLDVFRDSREIMFEEFELNQEPSSGAKRPKDFESFPRKFSQLFECLATEYLGETFHQVMLIHPNTKNAKIFRDFGDWLEEEQAIRQRDEEDDLDD